jgi:hypothetical protein
LGEERGECNHASWEIEGKRVLPKGERKEVNIDIMGARRGVRCTVCPGKEEEGDCNGHGGEDGSWH